MTTILGPDGKSRCRWCGAAPEFLDYHDTEWGFPVADSGKRFGAGRSGPLVTEALRS